MAGGQGSRENLPSHRAEEVEVYDEPPCDTLRVEGRGSVQQLELWTKTNVSPV